MCGVEEDKGIDLSGGVSGSTGVGEAFSSGVVFISNKSIRIIKFFNRLGELTMQLQGNQGSSGASAAKWTDEEV